MRVTQNPFIRRTKKTIEEKERKEDFIVFKSAFNGTYKIKKPLKYGKNYG